jgi:hypothetical protein
VTGASDATAIARAQSAEILFMVGFLFPFILFASVHFIPTRSFQVALKSHPTQLGLLRELHW